ncbi:MAG: acyltransferase family protein, partial [Muribaculaceae bacterium]|nr:acyltransferase family protein [Muribaculaceae bacterium]
MSNSPNNGNSTNRINGWVVIELSLRESNSLKGIALVLLLIHHLFYIQKGQYDDVYIGEYGIVNLLGIICKVCVAIFVFLSGYGLGTTISENMSISLRNFYVRRFTKLFLNYWFIWLLFVPSGILFFDRSIKDVYGSGNDMLVYG